MAGRKKTWVSGPPSRSPGETVLHELYAVKKHSYAEIARLYDVTPTTIKRWMRKAGISPRSQSEAVMLGRAKWDFTPEQKERLRETAKIARAGLTAESYSKSGLTQRGRKGHRVPWTDEERESQMRVRSTPEYREKLAVSKRGEKHYNWRGGPTRSNALLVSWQWRQRRQECYARDNWTCRDCGVKCVSGSAAKRHPGRRIQAHHIIPRRLGGGDELANLVTLCVSCHHRREHRYADALIA